jgi:8-oxo-dGTP diphosphatase
VKEETSLEVSELRLRGVIHVDVDDPVLGVLVFVFTAVAPEKRLLSSDEGAPEWINSRDLPGRASEMVEDLPTLLPTVLTMSPDDPPFFAAYSYDASDRLVITFADLR